MKKEVKKYLNRKGLKHAYCGKNKTFYVLDWKSRHLKSFVIAKFPNFNFE